VNQGSEQTRTNYATLLRPFHLQSIDRSIEMLPGMLQFPFLIPPTVDHCDNWFVVHSDEGLLAQEEQELKDKVINKQTHTHTNK